jgi:hypothetical protein
VTLGNEVAALKYSADATGAAAIAVAAAPVMSSGERNFSFAIMRPVYHQDQIIRTPN